MVTQAPNHLSSPPTLKQTITPSHIQSGTHVNSYLQGFTCHQKQCVLCMQRECVTFIWIGLNHPALLLELRWLWKQCAAYCTFLSVLELFSVCPFFLNIYIMPEGLYWNWVQISNLFCSVTPVISLYAKIIEPTGCCLYLFNLQTLELLSARKCISIFPKCSTVPLNARGFSTLCSVKLLIPVRFHAIYELRAQMYRVISKEAQRTWNTIQWRQTEPSTKPWNHYSIHRAVWWWAMPLVSVFFFVPFISDLRHLITRETFNSHQQNAQWH